MTLVALLISLAIEQLQGPLQERRTFAPFVRWVTRVRQGFRAWPLDGTLGVIVILAPPAFLVWVVRYQLLYSFWPLALAFDVIILVYCLGPRSLTDQVDRFLEAHQRGDSSAAHQMAVAICGQDIPEDDAMLVPQVIEGILVQANRRVLGVLAWFVLLGPLGAVLYRLTEQLAYTVDSRLEGNVRFPVAAVRLYALLDWLPARLTTLGYALAGSFQGAMEAIRAHEDDWWGLRPANNEAVLAAGGRGAIVLPAVARPVDRLADRADIESALALVKRTLVLGLFLVTLTTLSYWAG